MRKILSIAAGGMAGAVLRYLIRNIDMTGGMPLDTLAVNAAGSFLLALLLTLAMGALHIHDDIQAGLTAGFFGAFTTFSSVCQESVTLFADGHAATAAVYMLLTVVLGLAAAFAGYRLARRLEARGAADGEEDE